MIFEETLRGAIDADPHAVIEIDLVDQFIKIVATGEQESFEVNPYKKACMTNGYDDIDYILSKKELVEEFEGSEVTNMSLSSERIAWQFVEYKPMLMTQ
jgi:3-isopropylmalate dehydratase small subunit